MKRHSFSAREHEIIALAAIGASIDELVNHSLLSISANPDATEVGFQSVHHQAQFSALLTDFLEPVSLLSDSGEHSLALLSQICRDPQFDEDGLIEFLEEPTSALERWLTSEVTISAWMPSLNTQADLRMARSEFVRICGTVSKHGLGRLTRTAKRLGEILGRNGFQVQELDALLALDDFYERFHTDVMSYHASVLAEMLNNIRWGMWEYLRPTFMKALDQKPGQLEYRYRYPAGIDHDFARSCFWDAMNDVRRQPYVGRFSVDRTLRLRY